MVRFCDETGSLHGLREILCYDFRKFPAFNGATSVLRWQHYKFNQFHAQLNKWTDLQTQNIHSHYFLRAS